MKDILEKTILLLMITFISCFIINTKVFARSFDSSIDNIYELRNVNTWLSGYAGNIRPFASDAYTHGYYLGTQTQFLPYKVGKATLNQQSIVTEYEYALFCTLFGASSPAKNSYSVTFNQKVAPSSCTIYNNWDIGIQAGVGAIINNVMTDNYHYSKQQLQEYYDAEIAINQFLYQKLGNSCNIDNSSCGSAAVHSVNEITSYDKELVALANAAYDEAKKLENTNISVVYPSNKVLNYSEDEEIWKSERITINNLNKYKNSNQVVKAVLKGATGKENYAYITAIDNSGTYQIGVCNGSDNYYCKDIKNFEPLKAGKYTVEVTIGGETSYEIAQNYSCGSEFQTVTPAFTDTKIVKDELKATFTFEVEEETGSLTIKKVDEDGVGLQGATITIIGEDVTYNRTFILGNRTIKELHGLKFGTYIVKETKAPDGYVKDETSYKVVINELNPNGEVIIENIEDEEPEEKKFKFALLKVDEKGKAIEGSEFNIYYGNTKVEVDYVSEDGILSRYVEVGQKVCIEETAAPSGYKIVQDKFCFKLDKNGKIILDDDYPYVEVFKKTNTRYGLKVTNLPEDKSITYVKKIDATTNKTVAGAKLQLTDSSGKVIDSWETTDKEHIISGLTIGTYYIEEIEAPKGYSINKNKQTIKITSASQVQTVEFKNTPIVAVPDTLANVSKVIIVIGIFAVLTGAIVVYKNKKEKNI